MYEFVTGPLAWIAFLVFIVGVIWRAVWYVKGLSWQLDRVAYGHHRAYGIRGAVRSIFYWLIPYGTQGWRQNRGFTVLVFVFHIGLLLTPLLLRAHNVLWMERWGFQLPSLPEALSDGLTFLVLAAALGILIRRVALPEVRILTTFYDIVVIAIAVAPFATGFVAYHHWGDYNFWLIMHILSGEIWLMAIPFTKLSHFVLFFCSRAQLGMDYGIKRGGMKNKGLAW
jgi:nitrate reductase gamma subunit